ncbi:hypothetical protein C8R45DRAFT_1027374 [Mycena sanguinolenta]|nr:hypothetical protein C8R45DRAFT_1027374 [Mycena sanguinolenta]
MASLCSTCGTTLVSTRDAFKFSLTTDPWTLVRLSQLSSTNEPLLEPELSAVRPIVEKTSARLATLDAETSRLKDRLRELEDERTALSEFHAQNTRVVSPMRRMPAEILGEIFSWTLPNIYDIFDPGDCPWVLTRVCGSWRAVALSKPSFWSLLVFDFTRKSQYPRELVQLQLKRARSLKIHFFGNEMDESRPQIALFRILAGHCARWEELDIRLTSGLVPILMSLDWDPIALRKARVWWDTEDSQPSAFDSVDFLRRAISLVDVTVHCEYQFLPTPLPLVHQLTRYDFDAPWTTHKELLRSLPNLEEVRICCDFDFSLDLSPPGKPIELLHLRRLYVNTSTSLDYLHAPSLEEIAIQLPGTSTYSTTTRRSLEGFLARSSCSPYCLRIHGLLDTESMTAILQKFPSFTEISVTDDNDEDLDNEYEILSAFVAMFTITKSTPSPMMFPHITKIGFACQGDAIVCPLLLNMLESRWNDEKCVLECTELVLRGYPIEPDPRSLARIERLREAGLRLSLLLGRDAHERVDRWRHMVEWS